jgi:hypothetical protein
MKTATKTIGIHQFGIVIGTADRTSYTDTAPFRAEYMTGGPQCRVAMKEQFIVGYLMGNLKINEAKAKAVFAKGRAGSVANAAAFGRGRSQFTYHVITVKAGGNAKVEVELRAITKAQKASTKKFAAEFAGDTLAKQVRAAIAALKALL